MTLGKDADTLTNSGTIVGDLDAGAGNDVIGNTKLIFASVILGEGDNKLTSSGISSGSVTAGSGHDVVTNTGVVSGLIRLGGGDDVLTDGNFNTVVRDEAGDDKYSLGGGNDQLILATDNDQADGGAGSDGVFLVATTADSLINLDTKSVTLPGQVLLASSVVVADDGISATIKNFEEASGSIGVDIIAGNAGANKLSGFDDNDALYGGLGADTLRGGAGSDYFYYLSVKDSGNTRATRDTIADFATGDKIVLSGIDANTKTAAHDTFNLIADNTAFTAAGQLRLIFDNGDTVVQGDVNGDGKADFSIALTGIHNLTVADFSL